MDACLLSALEQAKPIFLHANSQSYESPEDCLHLPFDTSILQHVQSRLSTYDLALVTDVVLVGIGGSNLGTVSLAQALGHTKRLHILDSVSPSRLQQTLRALAPVPSKHLLIFAISKSGTTTETLANLDALITGLVHTHPDIHRQLICITDEASALWTAATEASIAPLSIPKMVGGRYSVFSSVGLGPLVALGIDVPNLLAGAQSILALPLTTEHPSIASAAFTFAHHQIGYVAHNSFFFHAELEDVGKWYRQLMGESIAKEFDVDGKPVHQGIIPLVSIGTTDLHSMAQLYFGGPSTIMHNLVSVTASEAKEPSASPLFPALNPMIHGKSLQQILEAIIQGTSDALVQTKRPALHITLASRTAYELGAYLAMRMLEIMILARLLSVNAFDQPNVEAYKLATKKSLTR